MDTRPLVEDDIRLGGMVRDALASDPSLRIRAAFWWFDEDRQEWLFATSTPLYEEKGAQAAYRLVRKVLANNGLLDKLPLDRVWIMDYQNPIFGAIRRMTRRFASMRRLVKVTVNGIALPDVFIYPVDKRRARPIKLGAIGTRAAGTVLLKNIGTSRGETKTPKRVIRPKHLPAKRRTKT